MWSPTSKSPPNRPGKEQHTVKLVVFVDLFVWSSNNNHLFTEKGKAGEKNLGGIVGKKAGRFLGKMF
jgi:hypothetical protein